MALTECTFVSSNGAKEVDAKAVTAGREALIRFLASPSLFKLPQDPSQPRISLKWDGVAREFCLMSEGELTVELQRLSPQVIEGILESLRDQVHFVGT